MPLNTFNMLNQNSAMCGLYRATVVETYGKQAKVFIPTLNSVYETKSEETEENFYDNRQDLSPASWCMPYKEGDQFQKGDAVWVAFEASYGSNPVIMGYFGKSLKSVGGSIGVGGGNILAQPGDYYIGDLLVKKNIMFQKSETNTGEYAVLHTSCCPGVSPEEIAKIVQNQDLSIHGVIGTDYVLQCAEWGVRCGHVGSPGNSKSVGLEQCESGKIKWNGNATSASWNSSDDTEIKAFHEKLYNNAVLMYAYLATQLNISADKVISHNEVGKTFGGTDHGDPEELWRSFQSKWNDNKWTMDAFRQAVSKQMQNMPQVRQAGDNSSGITVSTNYSKYIFVGDSRTVGMREATNSGDTYICEGGMGYSWMNKHTDEIINAITQNSGVYILMGVNDGCSTESGAGVVGQYINWFNKYTPEFVKKGATVIFVSVNPVDEGAPYGVTNELIEKFNNDIKSQLPSNVQYLDTYNQIKSTYKTIDKVHYDTETYKHIYSLLTGK